MHEWEVRQFYYNIEFLEDGSFNTSIGNITFWIDEKVLGNILKVERKGIGSVQDHAPAKRFIVEVGKLLNFSFTGISKKFLKGQYQLYFKFVNEVLLPRTKKRTIATTTDLFCMEALSKSEAINLPAILMEHIHEVMKAKDEKYGLAYGYLFNHVFDHFAFRPKKGLPSTIKQSFSQTTLVECECNKERVGNNPKSHIFDLIT